ncbi:hypothetical protein L2E82_15052 [Cichorium intybus]|uniref:Uncharacterized protein n=1 Tax=Cichorium intybus TaxID=13427 RepID=A0ACB9F243_CICIN|nr:hypothetical protein L2E82_15052 [Cichorium intybus]
MCIPFRSIQLLEVTHFWWKLLSKFIWGKSPLAYRVSLTDPSLSGKSPFGKLSLASSEILSRSVSQVMDVFLSDFDSYSESSSSDDQEDDEFMYSGQASCILSNLQETIGKIDDLLLFERRYVHGDIVSSLNDHSQMGKVTNFEMIVDLENLNEKKLKNINSKDLQRIRSISMGDYVISGPWVGKADQITDSVTVLFDDGTKCEFTITAMDNLIPMSPDLVDDSQYPYYPGQRVKLVNSTRSNSTRWLCGSRTETHNEGTVCKVDAGSVHVTWLGCALFGSEGAPVPPSVQSSKDLTPISCFLNWQLGDWCVLPKISHSDFQEIFVISKTKCKIDVLWQDGSESFGLDSSSLNPVNTLDAHDFWPHQFVLEKGTSDDQENKKSGVVKEVDAKEKTVRVKWELENEGKSMEEIVSAYELIDHPDYSFSQGDLVFRLHKGQNYDNIKYLGHIGIVVGLKNGLVEVKWATGFTSKVTPHEIFRVEKSEGVSATQLLNNVEPNQEKSEYETHTPDPTEKDSSDSDDDEKDCLKTLYDSTTFNTPRAAIGFLSSFATRLFGSRHYTSLVAVSDHVSLNGSISSEEDDQVFVETNFEKSEDSNNVPVLSCTENPKEFKQFDMVNNCSDHHFFDSPGKGSISSQVKKCWLKKVQQEWNILGNDLPETIYVRVFEERMDLIQAAIIGAPGTPYQDALFFFDIYLPPEYPNEPPMVHYNSGGLRVNPNLYESGRVCLSLLNTWTGTGTETWNPNGSTILQVLLSLQALVLNQKPYFNEAGYDQQVGSVEGEKNSCSYNENAFLMSCKSMLYILRKPPKHFEALVEEHFSKRYVDILMACKAYLEGVPVGGQNVVPKGQNGNSTGFKIMLSKLVPKLVEVFTAKGYDCDECSLT